MQSDCVLELPSDLRMIEGAVQYLMDRSCEAGFDEERLRLNFRVGLSEALANAMLYGNGRDPKKRVRVEARFSDCSVVVRVTDEGCGFDPRSIPDPTLPGNRRRTRGRGIYLIKKLMDHVEFNEQGNSITMVLLRGPGNGGRVAEERETAP